MKKEVLRRLEALEECRAPTHTNYPVEGRGRVATLNRAILIGFALRLGAEAREELDAANGTLDPERRAKLSKTLAAARLITATLTKYRPAKVS